ncbi:MAG: type II toxin-antitoxin system PemK/MazF family toxin [Clostridia bacterium]|nr:type II toxin-antitoxin system PemK/MazF family toxin [Clostridia bacterium]
MRQNMLKERNLAANNTKLNNAKSIGCKNKKKCTRNYANCLSDYSSSSGITSDLVNSYAWDTAIIFIQQCSGTTDYYNSKGTSGLVVTGNKGDENNFNPTKLKTYERGDIIKVNLGFNIGSELGGLHYCVVIDKKNNRNSPVVTVIPLSSQKTDRINKNSIMLGNDIYNQLVEKSNKLLEDSKIEIEENKNQLLIETKKLTENNATSDEIYSRTTELNNNITEAYKKLELAEKINKEVKKMKFGSIAIVNQIRVISKQRIYDPKTEFDILSGIKLSNENLDLIDEKIRKMFIKN